MNNRWVWHCPLGGLEYVLLLQVGWRIEHTLYVDGIPWAKLSKSKDCVDNTAKVLS